MAGQAAKMHQGLVGILNLGLTEGIDDYPSGIYDQRELALIQSAHSVSALIINRSCIVSSVYC